MAGRFHSIALVARTFRTERAALKLLGLYLDSGDALYPVDVALFAEVFGETLPGAELVSYDGVGGYLAELFECGDASNYQAKRT